MPNISTWNRGERIACIVFGDYGSGKTFGAGTFPRPNFLDFDRGIGTLLNPEFTSQYGLRSVEYAEFFERRYTTQGVVQQHNAFDDACRYFDQWMKRPDEFDTWVIDSATMLTQMARNKAIVLLGGGIQGIKSSTHSQAVNTGLVYMKQQDYGAERSLVEQFVRMIKDSGKHVVVLCHTGQDQDRESGTVTSIHPLLTGASRQVVPSMFDEVWKLNVIPGAKPRRTLQTHGTPVLKAKTRYGIPDGTEWSYDAIVRELKKITEQQKTHQPTQQLTLAI